MPHFFVGWHPHADRRGFYVGRHPRADRRGFYVGRHPHADRRGLQPASVDALSGGKGLPPYFYQVIEVPLSEL